MTLQLYIYRGPAFPPSRLCVVVQITQQRFDFVSIPLFQDDAGQTGDDRTPSTGKNCTQNKLFAWGVCSCSCICSCVVLHYPSLYFRGQCIRRSWCFLYVCATLPHCLCIMYSCMLLLHFVMFHIYRLHGVVLASLQARTLWWIVRRGRRWWLAKRRRGLI